MLRWPWPKVIAHRCGGALAPENTLAGLAIAARIGCRAVEFDVMLSRDGEPVLIHESNHPELGIERSKLISGSYPEADPADRFHHAFAGETIPSLHAALRRCRELGLAANLEIKPAQGHDVETGRVVGRRLASLGVDDRPALLLSSFSADALEAAMEDVDDIPRGWLAGAFDAAALKTASRLGCASIHLALDGLEAAHVVAARAAGLEVLVYTVNRLADARRLASWGVGGLFTDRPDLLLDTIR